ncbi:MAG: hypothetical protein JW973_17880 [Bacteroidales bacterium]|nr:hypothetical protein [Bacteroidales bacterium]
MKKYLILLIMVIQGITATSQNPDINLLRDINQNREYTTRVMYWPEPLSEPDRYICATKDSSG